MMRLVYGSIAAAAALVLALPASAMASPSDPTGTAAVSAGDVRVGEELFAQVNSRSVEADRKTMPAARPASGSYPKRKGVILVTKDAYKDLIPTGHAAMVLTERTVIESIREGVKPGPNNWNTSKKTAYGVTPRKTTNSQDAKAAEWAYKQRHKPYNFNYLDTGTRKKFYCSQLVWAAYKDNFGINLDTGAFGNAVHPVELLNKANMSLLYKK